MHAIRSVFRGGPAVAVHQVLGTGFYKFTAFSSGSERIRGKRASKIAPIRGTKNAPNQVGKPRHANQGLISVFGQAN